MEKREIIAQTSPPNEGIKRQNLVSKGFNEAVDIINAEQAATKVEVVVEEPVTYEPATEEVNYEDRD